MKMSKHKKNKEVSWHTLNFICNLTNALRPKPELSLVEWADTNMVLPKGSNAAGKFNSNNVPYQKEIMNAITDPQVSHISVVASAQVGKTTMILCGMGYYTDYEPTTQMLVIPTLKDAERFSKTKIAPMISDVEVLSKLIAPAKSRDSNNTIMYKEYPGGYIVISGANSPSSLAMMPARIIWMDEVDRFPESAGTEGNPILLAEARAESYWNAKFIQTSTPTRPGSNIINAFENGSMEEWNVKCPACGKWQTYEWERVLFDEVAMTCVECGEIISERDWKSSEHKWIASHPERIDNRSFKLNALASPWTPWQRLIDGFKKAYERMVKYHNPKDMITFYNTKLGRVWEDTLSGEDDLDENSIGKRAERYNADIPDGVLLLTAAIDVQDDRFEIEVKGWARDYENWGIYKTEIYGELKKNEIWDELEDYLNTTFYFEDGRDLNIAAFAIDTGGHFTNKTYKWIKKMKKKGKRVYGVKGYAQKPDIPLLYKNTKVEIKEKNKNGDYVVIDTTDIYILGVDAGKEDITCWLKIDEPGEGYCHFPSNPGRGYDKKYYEGLTSERQIEKIVRGQWKKVWVKKSGVRNEPLDLFNYNYACCELLKPIWSNLEKKLDNGINYMKRTRKGPARRRKGSKGIEV